MSTEKYFKTKLVRDKVEVEYNSEDDRVVVWAHGIVTSHLYLNYDEVDHWIRLLEDLKVEVEKAKHD